MKLKLLRSLLMLLSMSSTLCLSSQSATALNFDGVNDNMVIPQQISGDFTLEYWIRTTQVGGTGTQWYNGKGVVDSEVAGVTNDFGTAIVGNKIAFGLGNPDVTIFSTSNINTGSWMHVSATWKQSTGLMSLYVNGVLEASTTSGTGTRSSAGLAIGSMYTNVTYFNGDIDELRIWNVERTPSQLAANYLCTLGAGISDPGLKVRYSFDQGIVAANNSTVTTLFDLSGNSVNATLNNFALTGTVSNWIGSTVVNPSPTITVNSGTICSGQVFTMTPAGASTYSFSSGSATVAPITNTFYTVTGTSTAGCVNSATITSTITVNNSPTLTVNSGSICAGDVFTLVPSGASSYTFSNSSATVNPVTSTSYSVTGTSSDGCVSVNEAIATVSVGALPILTASGGSICSGQSFNILTGGASTYTISGGNFLVSPITNTSYSVTGTSAEGCISSNPAVASITVVALPLVTASSGTICGGSSFIIALGGASTYTISGGTSTVSPLINTTYAITGSSLGCVSSNTAISSVTVLALPVVSVTSGSICTGEIFTLVPTGALTYTFANGSTTVNPSITTSYSVSGTNSLGCVSSNTAVSTITVFALPTLSITAPSSICATQSVTLIASGASSYTWNSLYYTPSVSQTPTSNITYTLVGVSFNGCTNSILYPLIVNPTPTITLNSGAICPGNFFVLTPSGADTYTYSSGSTTVFPTSTTNYSVTGTSLAGCESLSQAVATVSVVNTLSITVSGTASICNGQTASLTANGASSYSWSTGVATNTIILSPTINTSYTVTGSSGTCSNIAVISVTVNSLPVISVNSGSICEGATFTLTPSGAANYTYTGGTALVTPSVTSVYSVTGTDANGCDAAAVTSTVIVQDLPTISIMSSAEVICLGETSILTSSGAVTYSWNTGAITNSTSISPAATTNYTVTGTDLNGCSNSASITQTVTMCTSIISNASTTFKYAVYPNPSSGEFFIEISNPTTLTVFNSLGESISEQIISEGKNTIDLHNYVNGIYFIMLSQNNQTSTLKIIKN